MGSSRANVWRVGAKSVDLVRPQIEARPLSIDAQPQALRVDAPHSCAVVGNHLDQPFAFELLQGLPDGLYADAEAFGDRCHA